MKECAIVSRIVGHSLHLKLKFPIKHDMSTHKKCMGQCKSLSHRMSDALMHQNLSLKDHKTPCSYVSVKAPAFADPYFLPFNILQLLHIIQWETFAQVTAQLNQLNWASTGSQQEKKSLIFLDMSRWSHSQCIKIGFNFYQPPSTSTFGCGLNCDLSYVLG